MFRAALLASVLFAFAAPAAHAADILIKDDKSGPESMAAGPDGTLYVGSANTPYVYKVAKGSTAAEVFIDASKEGPGTYFWGVLTEPATNTLWTCQHTTVAGATPPRRVLRMEKPAASSAMVMESAGVLSMDWNCS